MKRLHISYTILNLWRSGKVDEMVAAYFHEPHPITPAMERGRTHDLMVEDYIKRKSVLPPEHHSDSLQSPRTKEKLQVEYQDRFLLSCELDAIDEPIIYEFKCGTGKDSSEYANDFQGSMYLWIAHLKKLPVDRLLFCHYNPETKEEDRTLVWKTPEQLERAENFVTTLSPEIYNYFETTGLLDRIE